MPDNEATPDAERRRQEYAEQIKPETPRERRYREALERLRDGVFFLHHSEVKKIVDEALNPG